MAELLQLPLDSIRVNEQVRLTFGQISELADKIRASRFVNPIQVRESAKGYILVAGERRLRALRMLREEFPDDEFFAAVPATLISGDWWSTQMVENLGRKSLTWLEMGKALETRKRETGQSLTQICDSIGIHKTTGSRYASIYRALSPEVYDKLLKSKRTTTVEQAERFLKPYANDPETQLEKVEELWGLKKPKPKKHATPPRPISRKAAEALHARLLSEGGTLREIAILECLMGIRKGDPLKAGRRRKPKRV
jgi:ParB/RepB/Spo0J family partition protein